MSLLVIGAGPAGLTAGHAALDSGQREITVLEASKHLGGISRTEVHHGNRYDIGGHRFLTSIPEVKDFWEDALRDEFLDVSRLSRIRYDGKFLSYPLEPIDAFSRLGAVESARIMASYALARVRPKLEEEFFQNWVRNRFGDRLFELFFRSYTEKVWGIPCTEIRAEWAAQRIRNLSLGKAVVDAILGTGRRGEVKSLVKRFRYPRLGPGQMWETVANRIEQRGGSVLLESPCRELLLEKNRVVRVLGGAGEFEPGEVLSSMDLQTLIRMIKPTPPRAVVEAAEGLRFRDFLVVGLMVRRSGLFPDNWIYIHAPYVRVGRIQNFGNWSESMVVCPESNSSLGMEYFCNEGDELWNRSDESLIRLATEELDLLGLGQAHEVDPERSTVIRQRKAYPVYDRQFANRVAILKEYIDSIKNLQTMGRNGLHRYNNQDHSMLTAFRAIDNLDGGGYDLWTLNEESGYIEEQRPST